MRSIGRHLNHKRIFQVDVDNPSPQGLRADHVVLDLDCLHHLAMADLDRARERFPDHGLVAPDVQISVRGGRWTLRARGVAYDSVRAQVVTRDAVEFCIRVGMNLSFTVDVLNTYTEHEAYCLTRLWCHKMQYFVDISKGLGAADAFPADAVALYVEPVEAAALHDSRPPVRARLAQIRRIAPFRG